MWFFALLLGGCGGDSPSNVASDPTTAKDLVLRQTDLPKGWKATAALPFAHCGSNPFRHAPDRSKARFASGLADLQNMVVIFESEKQAEAAYTKLTSESGFRCFRRRAEAEISEYSGGKILKPLRALEKVRFGSAAEGRRMSVEVESAIGPVFVYVDVAYAREGPTVMFLKLSCGLAQLKKPFFERIARLATLRIDSSREA